ncbi:MAG: hypothetical protein SO154_11340, partial [Prevotella sp.]|nr:hypothetical protein [Prevotella sp.]
TIPSVARVTRDEVSGLYDTYIKNNCLEDSTLHRVSSFAFGTVFQTAFFLSFLNPETSSRVTLAALGIGFQPNLRNRK